MEKLKKHRKITINDLAIMVAKGFEKTATKTDLEEVIKDVKEIKEDTKNIKKNILNLGDRFVSYHTFDSLATRVKILEDKKK